MATIHPQLRAHVLNVGVGKEKYQWLVMGFTEPGRYMGQKN